MLGIIENNKVTFLRDAEKRVVTRLSVYIFNFVSQFIFYLNSMRFRSYSSSWLIFR